MSLKSCADISDLFRLMFPTCAIAKNFSMGKTKCSYVINYGIAKYFFENLIEDVNACNDFVICCDEALNKVAQRGQMDLVIK